MDKQDRQDRELKHEAITKCVIGYLNATGIDVGLLIKYGNPKLEYERFTRRKDCKHG
jgi:hypothetical protein